MSRKHFNAIAEAIRFHNVNLPINGREFSGDQVATLAQTLKAINPGFDVARFIRAAGPCGGPQASRG